MPANCTTGDIGIGVCPCHLLIPIPYTTIFTTGAATVLINGKQASILGTIGIASCGHPTIALTGTSLSVATGVSMHRLGDIGNNCGTYIANTGSANVVSN